MEFAHNPDQKEIYQGEIWQKTNCLHKEFQINQTIYDLLREQGFLPTDHEKIWKKNDRTVVVSLVDDLRSCSTDYHSDLPYLFDRFTTVITDNYVTCPTQYQVIRLPDSFFGIYGYHPSNVDWQPDRDFSFAVNRLDHRRMHLMLDLAWRTRLNDGYVNFNCQRRSSAHASITLQAPETSAQVFRDEWEHFTGDQREKFQPVFKKLESRMPYKNHDLGFDEVHLRSYLNIVLESYSSDNNISVSEKIFRALVTPVPWTVYSGRYTVAWLESLGFDCLGDIIDHNHYDRLKEVEDRPRIFNWKSLETVKELKNLPLEGLKIRCQTAAEHNQHLLIKMAGDWDSDFKAWVDVLPSRLARVSNPG